MKKGNKMSFLIVNGKHGKERNLLSASQVKIGQVFVRQNDTDFFMRVKPTSLLLNSSLVGDKLNNGDPLIINLYMGTCYFISGKEQVKLVESANLEIQK